MKNNNLVTCLVISCFLFSSLYAQAAPRTPDVNRKLDVSKPPDPRKIRYGATISGVEGSYKCGQTYIDNMKRTCDQRCRQKYSIEQQREKCVNGCEIAHDELRWVLQQRN